MELFLLRLAQLLPAWCLSRAITHNLLADPFVAIASITAFSISEISDYIVYSKYKSDFNKRVIVSSLVSVPIDTAVFLAIISHLSALSFIVMCISKLLVVAYYVRFKK